MLDDSDDDLFSLLPPAKRSKLYEPDNEVRGSDAMENNADDAGPSTADSSTDTLISGTEGYDINSAGHGITEPAIDAADLDSDIIEFGIDTADADFDIIEFDTDPAGDDPPGAGINNKDTGTAEPAINTINLDTQESDTTIFSSSLVSNADTSPTSIPSSPPPSTPQQDLIHQIERIFSTITDTLTSPTGPHPLTIFLTPRRRRSTSTSTTAPAAISFPASAHRFTCILKILSLIHTTLTLSLPPTTKRDIFYQHPTLFRNQATVDRILDDLAATFHVPRSALGIVGGSKGLAFGPFRAGNRDYNASGGALIVPGETGQLVIGKNVEWVLIVEKEAVFRGLCTGEDAFGGKGIVVTGKGYPDVATREMVVGLMAAGVKRVFALVDMDPYGVEIMATYKFGSGALAHERHRLAVEAVEWLGVKTGDLEEVIAEAGTGEVEGIMALTEKDRKRAVSLLGREWMKRVPDWRNEIQKMLFLGIKVEIEILNNRILKQWVEKRILDKINGKRK